jgi:HdeA/HdeB family
MIISQTRRRAARSIAIAAILSGISPLAAQTTDLGRVTCADFLTLAAPDQAQLALWLAGYYAGAAQRPVIDRAKSGATPAALQELCTKTPQIPLIGLETRPLFVLPPNQ